MSYRAMSRRRVTRAILASTRSFFREPLTVGLLLVLPLVAIELYSEAFATFHAQIVADSTARAGTVGQLTGAVFATATLAGVLGLFQVISARKADARLVICGLSGLELLGARILTILAIVLLIAGVSVAWLLWSVSVASPALAVGVLVLAGLLYSLLGIVIGTLLPRELEGSLLLVVVADLDNVFASGVMGSDSPVGTVLPLHYPHRMFEAAALDGTVNVDHVLATVVYALVLLLVVIVAYRRLIVAGGGSA